MGAQNSVETVPADASHQALALGAIASNPIYAGHPDGAMEPGLGGGGGGPRNLGLAGPPAAAGGGKDMMYAMSGKLQKGAMMGLDRGSSGSGFDAASISGIGIGGLTDDGSPTPDQQHSVNNNGGPPNSQYASNNYVPSAARASPPQMMGYNAASRPMSYNGGGGGSGGAGAPSPPQQQLGHSATVPRQQSSYNGGGLGVPPEALLGFRSRSPSMGPPQGNAYWVEGQHSNSGRWVV